MTPDERDRHCDPEEMALAALGESADIDTDHLAACDQCRAEVASLRRIVRVARSIDDQDYPSPPGDHVWDAIRAEIHDEDPTVADPGLPAQERDADVPATRSGSLRTTWLALAAAVGLLLGGIVGVTVARTASQSGGDGTRLLAQAALQPLPGYDATGSARIEADADGESVRVDLSGLPRTEGYYEIWLLAEDAGAMISLGALGASERSTLPLPPGVDLDRFRIVDVSAESFDGDPTHSAVSVVRGTLQV